MIDTVKSVAILGSSGTIGSLIGGIIAQEGIKVYFLSRTLAGAKHGLERAISQARSEVISRNIVCGGHAKMLKIAVEEADWILEAVAEDINVKRAMYEQVEECLRPGTIVSSTTSSLPLTALAQGRSNSFQRNFLSTHFYNPPGRMLACETTGHETTDPDILRFMNNCLRMKLRREVVCVNNVVGFAGNRIAFPLLNRIAALASEFGVEMMDYLIGPYTGRMMAPLATLDLVGLDIHKAIIGSLYENTHDEMHDYLVLPEYISKMIQMGALGNKTKRGFRMKLESGRYAFWDPVTCDYIPAVEPHIAFVERAKHLTRMGMYRAAFDSIKKARDKEAEIVREILCTYVNYSYSRIGEVTDRRFAIRGIDRVMATGFHWASPSVILSMLGKDFVMEQLEERGVSIAKTLKEEEPPVSEHLEVGKYFVGR